MPENFAYFFKCFAHKSRNEILELLATNGEMTVESLAAEMNIQASTVSRHLGLFKMQGIVDMRAESPVHYYFLDKETIKQRLNDYLAFLQIK